MIAVDGTTKEHVDLPFSWAEVSRAPGTVLGLGEWDENIYGGRLDRRSDHRLTIDQLPRCEK